jgi:hypothetical protein
MWCSGNSVSITWLSVRCCVMCRLCCQYYLIVSMVLCDEHMVLLVLLDCQKCAVWYAYGIVSITSLSVRCCVMCRWYCQYSLSVWCCVMCRWYCQYSLLVRCCAMCRWHCHCYLAVSKVCVMCRWCVLESFPIMARRWRKTLWSGGVTQGQQVLISTSISVRL